MQLYVIRHAQSENNARWAQSGSDSERLADPPLTSLGVQQAQRLAQFLALGEGAGDGERDPFNHRGFGLTHLYCSLMQRAVHTADILAETLALQPQGWAEIHERGGIYEQDPQTGARVGLPGLDLANGARAAKPSCPEWCGTAGAPRVAVGAWCPAVISATTLRTIAAMSGAVGVLMVEVIS